MGLDMYLDKAKRIGNASAKDITALNNYFDWRENAEANPIKFADISMKEWCNIDESEVPKDLIDAYRPEFVHRYSSWDKEQKYGFRSLWQNVAYWRKANQIHNWFVENVQNGEDDCGDYEVSKEQLRDLLDICKVVRDASEMVDGMMKNGDTYENGKWTPVMVPGRVIKNPSVAKELLPTTDGFFFGSTGYDQWYMDDIESTITQLEKILAETDFDHEIVMYASSW